MEIAPKFAISEEILSLESSIPSTETFLWKYWETFVRNYLRTGKSEVTVRNVRDALKFVSKHLGILTIEACNTPSTLREALFKAKEERSWQYATFNTIRKNLNTYFLWLANMEYINENKIKKIEKCKEEQNEQYTLHQREVQLIRSQILSRRQSQFERWRNLLFFEISILTGARPCEIEQIQVRDVEIKENSYEIVIRGRKQKGRIRRYRLPSNIRDTFEMYLRKRQTLRREELYLFCSQSKRSGWTQKGMRGLWKRLSKELNFKITSYSIRRFVATHLYLQGVPLKDIQQHLGHTRLSTTLRYIEKTCSLTNRGVEEMEKLMNP